ncbi:MAG TPA: adenylosuccinate synthetase, partial [Bacteroidia bacterium]|nr:adenylosuccinate synthetase [Bacteroidia bacterium]
KHRELLKFHGSSDDPASLEAAWFEGIEVLKTLTRIDSEHYLNEALSKGKRVLAEGAQGSLLDIDFGTYPFVTSSNTMCAGACTGLGIPPGRIGGVIGIFKAYCTRVGSGPFPTELLDETGEQMRDVGREFGSTTGRPRRCGWLDLPALRYAIMINGVTELMMMKADVLSVFKTIRVCTAYKFDGVVTDKLPYDIIHKKIEPVYVDLKGWNSDLTTITSADEMPVALQDYIAFIERETGVPVSIVSVGPDRKQTLLRNEVWA